MAWKAKWLLTWLFVVLPATAVLAINEQCAFDGSDPDGSHRDLRARRSSQADVRDGLVFIQTVMFVQQDPVVNRSALLKESLSPLSKNSTWSGEASFGRHANMAGDLESFVYCIASSIVVLIVCVLVFSYLRLGFPLVYSANVLSGRTPDHKTPPGGLFGWLWPSWQMCVDDIEKVAGLDCAMYVEFHNFCFKLLGSVGFPMIFIMCPLHYHCGGMAAGDDLLSRIGMANLQPSSWLYWAHSVIVWLVVYAVHYWVHDFQAKFLPRRYRWLKSITHPRAATILVENIPQEYCSDKALFDLMCRVVSSEAVESAYIVKKTKKLGRLMQELRTAIKALKAAKFDWKQKRRDNLRAPRPTFRDIWMKEHDTIQYYDDLVQSIMKQMAEEKNKILDQARDGGSEVCADSGFVTFTTSIAAKVALQLQFSSNKGEFVTSIPPDPSDVIYTDLQVNATYQEVYTLVGHFLSFALFVIGVPVVIFISYLTNLDSLRHIHFVDTWAQNQPNSVLELLKGPCASLGLTIWMSLLPTVFMTIFVNCFKLSAHAWAQHQLECYYYWFMVFFGIVVAAMSGSWMRMQTLSSPMIVFEALATNLPQSTHFYLGYMAVQWWLLGLDLTRIWNWSKFMVFRCFYEEEEAQEMCEPEDQDYYGMGGRSARATYNMLIALVFCSLSPLISVLAFLNFGIAKCCYAYLFYFAETRKPDLGGIFWVQQLDHINKGMYIYILLMLGVLFHHPTSIGPCIIAAPSLVLLYVSNKRFQLYYHWESLPFNEVGADEEEYEVQAEGGVRYIQPELVEVRQVSQPFQWSTMGHVPSDFAGPERLSSPAFDDSPHALIRRRSSKKVSIVIESEEPGEEEAAQVEPPPTKTSLERSSSSTPDSLGKPSLERCPTKEEANPWKRWSGKPNTPSAASSRPPTSGSESDN